MAFTIRVSHSTHGVGNAPMSMALSGGVFAERDLDVIMNEFRTTRTAIGRLFTGETDLAVGGATPVLHAAMRGEDPIIVMSIEAENVFGVIGASHVASPEDLRRGTVGIMCRGDNDEMIMHRALREWDIDPDTEVDWQVIEGRGALWDALVAGEIDAMTATIPQPILARQVGLPVLKDYLDLHEPFQTGTLVTTRRFADEHPEELQSFLAGQLEGIRRFQQDFEGALPHMKARSKLHDLTVLRETHALFAEALGHYVPTETALASVVRHMQQAGIEADVDISRIVEPSFSARL